MIIKPFNGIFNLLLFSSLSIVVACYFLFRHRSEKSKKIFLTVLCLGNIILFFVYKAFLSVDGEFLLLSGLEKFNWFNELPLQLCNINMFLIPIGILSEKRSIQGFSFFLAPIGAFMALVFPEPAFAGYAFSLPRIWGFYLTHFMVLICGLLIAALGFYRPQPKDFITVPITFFVVALFAHIVNIILRMTVCGVANYFFTFGAEISILQLFWKWMPVPFLYELPALLILAAYMGVVSLFFLLFDVFREKQN